MIRSLPELTDIGRQLVAGLSVTAESWQDEPVPAAILAAAEAAVADHRARWRLHHLQPDPPTVASLAAAWTAGAERPAHSHPGPAVDVDRSARRLDTRAILALWRLTDPDGFELLRKDPPAVGAQVSGATAADLVYAAGDVDQARELFCAELASDPASPGSWAGLGLVADGPAAGALRDEPELVRAVHCRTVEAGDPLAVAAWLGQGGPAGGE
jgi:hypothetical protein